MEYLLNFIFSFCYHCVLRTSDECPFEHCVRCCIECKFRCENCKTSLEQRTNFKCYNTLEDGRYKYKSTITAICGNCETNLTFLWKRRCKQPETCIVKVESFNDEYGEQCTTKEDILKIVKKFLGFIKVQQVLDEICNIWEEKHFNIMTCAAVITEYMTIENESEFTPEALLTRVITLLLFSSRYFVKLTKGGKPTKDWQRLCVTIITTLQATLSVSQIEECFGKAGVDLGTEVMEQIDTLLKTTSECEVFQEKQFYVGLIGSAGAGKSFLINALRGVKPGTEDAAKQGQKETTKKAGLYKYSEQIVLVDFPGLKHFSSIDSMDNSYLKYVLSLKSYIHFFIVICGAREFHSEPKIADILVQNGKPFIFVRTKLDQEVVNGHRDGSTPEEVIKDIRTECTMELSDKNLPPIQVFLVSNVETHLYDMSRLKKTLHATNIKQRQIHARERQYRMQLIQNLEDMADRLDKNEKRTKIVKSTSGFCSAGFGLTSGILLLVSPLTFGATLIPAAVCGTIAASGSVANVAATIAHRYRKKKIKSEAEKTLTKNQTESVRPALDEMMCDHSHDTTNENPDEGQKNHQHDINESYTVSDKVQQSAITVVGVPGAKFATGGLQSTTHILNNMDPNALGIFLKVGQGFKVATGVMSIVIAPVEAVLAFRDAWDVYKGNLSKIAMSLRDTATKAKEELHMFIDSDHSK